MFLAATFPSVQPGGIQDYISLITNRNRSWQELLWELNDIKTWRPVQWSSRRHKLPADPRRLIYQLQRGPPDRHTGIVINKYVSFPYWRAEMYPGRVTCCHLLPQWVTVSMLMGQTDGWMHRRQTVTLRFPLEAASIIINGDGGCGRYSWLKLAGLVWRLAAINQTRWTFTCVSSSSSSTLRMYHTDTSVHGSRCWTMLTAWIWDGWLEAAESTSTCDWLQPCHPNPSTWILSIFWQVCN